MKDKNTQKLSVAEIEGIKQQISVREEVLSEAKSMGAFGESLIQHSGQTKIEIDKRKKILEMDEDLIAKGREKDRIRREIREIEERVVNDRPTTNEMDLKLGTVESHRAIQKNIAFHKKHGSDMVKLQDLRRRLEPDDPMSGYLENVRPDAYDKKKTMFT